MRNFCEAVQHLKMVGFAPETIIDVGACYGTPEITDVFPLAYHYWFEPIEEIANSLHRYKGKVLGEVHVCAVGLVDEYSTLYVPEHKDCSGLISHKDTVKSVAEDRRRNVPVVKLDTFFSNRIINGPILLKTDCQGGDLNALKGGQRLLERVEVVITELQFFNHWDPTIDNTFGAAHAFMRENDFVLYDLANYKERPLDGALGQIDAFFVHKNSALRGRHAWG